MKKTFEALSGLNKGKEILSVKSSLTKMIEITYNLSKLELPIIPSWLSGNQIESTYQVRLDELMNYVEFDADDLMSLVHSFSNREPETWNQERAKGIIMGLFLNLLTRRNREKDIKTKIEIGASNSSFDYLFEMTRDVDELVFRDYCPNYLGGGLGNNNGSIGTLAYINSKSTHISQHAGIYKGKIENLIMIGNECNELGWCNGSYDGEIDLILSVNNKSNRIFDSIAKSGGRVKNLVVIFDKERYSSMMLDDCALKRLDNLVIGMDGPTDDDTLRNFSQFISFYQSPDKSYREELLYKSMPYTDSITRLALDIDLYNTDQMLSQVTKIKEELRKIG